MRPLWAVSVLCWWIEDLEKEAVEWQECLLIQHRYRSQSGCGAYSSNPLCDRQVVVSWTDAASSTRMLSAVFFDGCTFEYTRMRAPDEIMYDLIRRGDGMIGLLELLAVLLVVETWKEKLMQSKWHAYIDNDRVLYLVINASSRAIDVNQRLALEKTSYHGH